MQKGRKKERECTTLGRFFCFCFCFLFFYFFLMMPLRNTCLNSIHKNTSQLRMRSVLGKSSSNGVHCQMLPRFVVERCSQTASPERDPCTYTSCRRPNRFPHSLFSIEPSRYPLRTAYMNVLGSVATTTLGQKTTYALSLIKETLFFSFVVAQAHAATHSAVCFVSCTCCVRVVVPALQQIKMTHQQTHI